MTAGNNGSGTPENDDPFAYLYRSEGDQGNEGGQSGQPGAAPRTGGYGYPGPAQPGVPRTSYNQVRAVGERTYGQQIPNQQPQQAYGQQGYGQQGGQGRQNAHYAAPETLPGGAPRQPGAAAPRGGHGGGGRGPNSKGLLIGAIAVVAVVLVGIGVAMITNGDDNKDDQADPTGQPTAGSSVRPRQPSGPAKGPGDEKLPTEDAAKMKLAGGAAPASDIKGAKAAGGTYVGGLNTPGSSATWSLDVAKAKSYRLYVTYGVPGEDQSMSLTINGKKETRPLNMKNFSGAPKGDYEKGWTETWSIVQLTKGTNTITVSCDPGDKCDANIDQMWLAKAKG
ncbi:MULTISPECIES: carbohydrate-binding protein [Streptomyces]|uniref:carbohydrate-binding protein n=1 Tax=Streptomyces lycopersici TaxID=2974589 RepID=UPI0021D15ECD|nr:carbohydrate-binding protein [Streptomyces sp. NEAU-383]